MRSALTPPPPEPQAASAAEMRMTAAAAITRRMVFPPVPDASADASSSAVRCERLARLRGGGRLSLRQAARLVLGGLAGLLGLQFGRALGGDAPALAATFGEPGVGERAGVGDVDPGHVAA